MDTPASASDEYARHQTTRMAALKLAASKPDAPRGGTTTSSSRPPAERPPAVGDVVHVLATVTSGPFFPELVQSGDNWLRPIMTISKATAIDRGFVATGELLDAERLARNIKAKQVKLKGVLFDVTLISNALADQYHGTDEDTIPADDVLMDFSDSEFATTSSGSDSEAPPQSRRRKTPHSPTAKASHRAYKKRRESRKRALSNSGSNSEPCTVDPPTIVPPTTLADHSTDPCENPRPPSTETPTPSSGVPPPQSADLSVPAPTTAESSPVTSTPPAGTPQQPPSSTDHRVPASTSAVPPSSQRKKLRFTPLDLSKVNVTVDLPARETVLFRPVDPGDSFHARNPLHLLRALEVFGPFSARRHIRAGGLAIDFEPASFNEAATLATTELLGVKVTVSRPLPQRIQHVGVVTGVHPDLSESELCELLSRHHPMSSVKRMAKPGATSWAIKVTFSEGPVPEKVDICGRLHAVRLYKDRPLICGNCNRYGHPARTCRSKARCRHCSLGHPTTECPTPEAAATCCNCGGDHAAGAPSCPNNAFQAKVLETRKAHGLTFREARTAVTSATRSYAAALKQQLPTPATPGTSSHAAPVNRRPTPSVPAPIETATIKVLADLFKAVIAVLAEATEAQDFSGLAAKVTMAFAAHLTPLGL